MTQCARSRPLQSVRQAARALPTQSPPCQRQLAPSPHMLTASLPAGLHPFGPALLLLEQGSKAQGGQAVLGSQQTRSSCVIPSLSCPPNSENADKGKDALLLAAAAWLCLGVQPAGQLKDTRLWKFKSQMNSSLLPNSQ